MDFAIKPVECQPQILPLLDVIRLGPAARTLAAFYDIADQDRVHTFKSLARIAHVAGLSVSTVQRHITRLIETGHIEALGRLKPAGRWMARRSQTYRLTHPLTPEIAFLPLPKSHASLPWGQALVLAYLNRWASGGHVKTSPAAIASEVGLSARSVHYALTALRRSGIIHENPTTGGGRVRGVTANLTFAVNLSLKKQTLEAMLKQGSQERPPKSTAVKVVFQDPPSTTPPSPTLVQGPDWRNIQTEDLRTPAGRRSLFFAAVALGHVEDSHANRVYFRACCILALGKDNPGGYLRSMITNRWKPSNTPAAKKTHSPRHNLGHIERSDLTNPSAAVRIVEARMGPQSEHHKTLISAEAIHCLRVAKNPAAMFATNIASQRFFGTQDDESEALRRKRRDLEREFPRDLIEPEY